MENIFDFVSKESTSKKNSAKKFDYKTSIFDFVSEPKFNEKNEEEIPEEHFSESAARILQSNLQRAKEVALGAPGELETLGRAGINAIGEGLSEGQYARNKRYAEARGEDFSEAFPEKKPTVNPKSLLPTSEDIREVATKKLTGEYLEPRGKGEELLNDIATNFTRLVLPSPGGKLTAASAKAYKSPIWEVFGKELAKKAAVATAATGAKEGVKHVGGGESAQAAAEGVTMALGYLWGIPGAKSHASKLMRESEALIPAGETISATPLVHKIGSLKNSAPFRTEASSAAPAMNIIEKIEKKITSHGINNDRILMDDLVQFRKNINEERKKLGAFTAQPTGDKGAALRHLDAVEKAVISEIDNYGTVANPAFGKANKTANKAYATSAKLTGLEDFAKENLDKSNFGKHGLTRDIYALLAKAGTPLERAAAITYRMKNPALMKYYAKAMIDALNQNKSAFGHSVELMNKEMIKQDKYEKSLLND